MNPLREPGERFTRILGIDLMKDKLAEVITKLGKASMVTKGDGAEYVGKVCYLIDESNTVIEFNEWELGAGFALRKGTTEDLTQCAPLNIKISSKPLEINGLRLGTSKEEILRILGTPKMKTSNKWTYDFQGQAKAKNRREIARFGREGKYYWQFLIKITFEHSVVSKLELSPTVQT